MKAITLRNLPDAVSRLIGLVNDDDAQNLQREDPRTPDSAL